MPAWCFKTPSSSYSSNAETRSKSSPEKTTTRATSQAAASSRPPPVSPPRRTPTRKLSPAIVPSKPAPKPPKPSPPSRPKSRMRPDAGRAAGSAVAISYRPPKEPSTPTSLAESLHRLSFSSVIAEVGVDDEATRTVRFQDASPRPEPSDYPTLPSFERSRGVEYVNITQDARPRERPVPIYAPSAVPGTRSPRPLPVVPHRTPSSLYIPSVVRAPSPPPAVRYAQLSQKTTNKHSVAAPPSSPDTSSLSWDEPWRARIGPFRLMRMLGKGRFTKTYSALDHASKRVICARIARKSRLLQDERLRMGLIVEKRVYETIAAASAKDRAHLMELFGVVQDEESITFLMPLMDCDLIVMLNAMSEEHEEVVRTFARRWVAQLALGIDALHWMGIIHRDLKPENILVSASKLAVRIADFNTAYMDHAPLEDDVVYSCDKLGSEPYMAWEVDEGRHYGKMVDWWALGCIMFDMLTNSVLFEGHDARREYARWDDKWEGTSYVASAGKDKLSGAEVDLIYGLVDLDPLKRFQLRNLRYHNFFLNEKKCVNVFDVLLREPAADSDLLTYTSASEPLEVDGSLKDEPLLQAACPGERRSVQAQAQAHVPAQRAHRHPDSDAFEHGYRVPAESGDLFAELDWIHPRGLW